MSEMPREPKKDDVDRLVEAARNVLDWWHEWADHEPEEEETAAFEALEAALDGAAK